MGLTTVRAWAERKLAAVGMFAAAVLLWAMTATCANAAIGVSVAIDPSNPNPTGGIIYPGDVVYLKASITNNDNANPVTGVAFSTTFPAQNLIPSGGTAQMIIAPAGVVSFTCDASVGQNSPQAPAGGYTLTATPGSSTVTLSAATIPAAPNTNISSSCTIVLAVTSNTVHTASTNSQWTFPPGSVTANGGLSTSGTGQQSITVNAFNRPLISKSFTPGTVVAGNTTQLKVEIDNSSNVGSLPLNGIGDTDAFGFRDDLAAANLKVATPPASSVNCTGGGTTPNFAPAADATLIQSVGGTINGGGKCTFLVNVVATSVGTLSNTINASTDFKNKRGVAASANATANLTATSSLEVATAFQFPQVAAGAISTMTVTIKNTGGVTLNQDQPFTDFIDGKNDYVEETYNQTHPGRGLIIDESGPNQLTASGCGVGAAVVAGNNNESFTLTGGVFAPNATCTITIPFRGVFYYPNDTYWIWSNSIAAGAVSVAEGAVNNAASANVAIVNQFGVNKTVVGGNNIAPGGVVHYRLTPGSFFSTSYDVVITDALQGGLTILGMSNATTINNASPYAPVISGPAGCTGLTVDATNPSTPKFRIPAFPISTDGDAVRCDIDFYAQVPANATTGNTSIPNDLAQCDSRADTAGSNFCANNTTSAGIFFRDGLTVNQVFSDVSLSVGQTTTLTYTFSNIGSAAVTGLTFNNTLPTGNPNAGQSLQVGDITPVTNTCNFTVGPGTVLNGSTVALTGGTVPVRAGNGDAGTCVFAIKVKGAANAYENIIPGGNGGAATGTMLLGDGVTTMPIYLPLGTNSATVTFVSSLDATKSFSPSGVASGGTSTVTITLTNGSATTMTNVSVNDPFPAGMVLANPPAVSTTCNTANNPATGAAAGANSIAMTGATLAPNTSCVLTFNVTATGGSNWVNTIPAANITAAGGIQKVTDTVGTLTNAPGAGVTLVPNITPNIINQPGVPTTLEVTIQVPAGNPNLTNLGFTNYFTDTGLAGGVDTGMRISSTPAYSTTCSGGVVSATPGGTSFSLSGVSLNTNASCVVQIQITMIRTGTVIDRIPAGAVTSDQNISNNVEATTSVQTQQTLGVVKSFSPTIIRPGETSQMTITVYNAKELPPGGITAINVEDILPTSPGQMSIAATPGFSTTCAPISSNNVTPGGPSVIVGGFNLAAAAANVPTSCEIKVNVTGTVKGEYTNTIGPGKVAGVGADNTVAASAVLQIRSPVEISKSFTPASVPAGTISRAKVVLDNSQNAVNLTQTVLRDVLPANLALAPASPGPGPNPTTTCGGTVSAPANGTVVQLTGATIPASSTCEIEFNVVSNTPAIYTNTIPGGGLTTAGGLSTLLGVTNDDPASAQLTVTAQPSISKAFSPASISAGATSTLTITLTNPNNTIATLSQAMVDNLPTSPGPMIIATPPDIGGTCPTPAQATAGGTTVTYPSGATIPANGSCTITVDVTASTTGAYLNSIPVGQLKTQLGDNLEVAEDTLTISPLGSISGKVFLDLNNDGVFNGSDTPISGQQITLSVGPTSKPPVTTNASGNYQFTGLAAGAYTVTQTNQPLNTVNGITTAGTIVGTGAAGTATLVGVTPSAISGIDLQDNGSGQIASSPGNNFAEVQATTASISGKVYVDADDDGVVDAGETGIQSVTVRISGTQSNGQPLSVPDAQTDANGNYSFTNLPASDATGYTVTQVQPASNADGKTTKAPANPGAVTPGIKPVATGGNDTITGIVLTVGQVVGDYNFGELAPNTASISGKVYIDTDDDGVVDGGEAGIQTVTVKISGTMSNGQPLAVADVVTDANGNYSFTNLPASNAAGYTITQVQPTAYNDGKTTKAPANPGTVTPGIKPVAAGGNDTITAVVLTAGQTVADYNFGEQPNTASISGKVYIDVDDDGVVDGGEAGIQTVTVKISGTMANGQALVVADATTDANGAYSFTNLPASDASGYTITQVQPAAYTDGKTTKAPANPGTVTPGIKPVAASGNDTVTAIVLTAGQTLGDYNFGELSPANGSISGKVYVDTDNDGVVDGGEAGLPGVTIKISGTRADGQPLNVADTVTDANGAYSFTNLPASNGTGYTITQVQPATHNDGQTTKVPANPGTVTPGIKPVAAGGNDTITTIVLGGSQTVADYNFGEQPNTASISGKVYIDVDDDGVVDGGEAGIQTVTVKISGTMANGQPLVVADATTDANGAYSFTNLPASNASGYTITEVQPAAYADGKTTKALANPGTVTPGIKPVASNGNDTVTAIVLTAGQTLGDYNFGELSPATASISGKVYIDLDDDGVVDVGEAGIQGVTVKISGTKADGQPLAVADVTTDLVGNYSFTNLPASNGSGYTITQVQPTTHNDGKTTKAPANPGTVTPGIKPVAANGNDTIGAVVLTVGQTVGDYNFGEQPNNGLISGKVYIDVNDDGVVDGSESGIQTVTMKISGTMANGQPLVVADASTSVNGEYAFTDLPASNGAGYTITQVQPAAYTDGKTTKLPANPGTVTPGIKPVAASGNDTITGIALTTGQSLVAYNFGELAPTTASISGKVYIDLNDDGVVDGGENGIQTVTVKISGTMADGQPLNVADTVTDANGNYSFTNLPASNGSGYTITQVQPAAYADGKTTKVPANPGTVTPGIKPVAANGNDTITGIVLAVAQAVSGYNFGELAPTTASISGKVYIDLDDDGVVDGGEAGIQTVTVKISGTKADGQPLVVADATTDANGNYSFTNLPASNASGYTITQVQPAAYADGKTTKDSANPGAVTPGIKPVATGGNDTITGIVLTVGLTVGDYNFGELAPNTASISGKVYIDIDDDGVVDAGEAGIQTVTVKISGTKADGQPLVVADATTDANGAYSFTNLPASNGTGYTITQVQPAGYTDGKTTKDSANPGTVTPGIKPVAANGNDTITQIVLTVGQAVGDYNFGELAPNTASISGKVYVDADDDGVVDTGEAGIQAVTVKISGTMANGQPLAVADVTTDANGAYSFTNLPASDATGYTVTQVQPTAYNDGKTTTVPANPGTVTPGIKPVAANGNDTITQIVLTVGQTVGDYNFGEQPNTASVSGKVYVDIDDDGVVDAGEAGIQTVTVKISGTMANGQPLAVADATTDANGAYSFTNLPASNATGYTITQVQPASHSDGKTTKATNPGTVTPGIKPVAAGGNDTITAVVLTAGATFSDYNFGELAPNTASISGKVYLDIDDDGVVDTGETGIQPVTIKISGTKADGQPLAVADVTTDANGNYTFTNLPASDATGYTITQVQPTGYIDGKTTKVSANPGTVTPGIKPVAAGGNDTITGIVMTVGLTVAEYNFGERPSTGTIAGRVYVDLNDNGVIDGGEPGIAGVVVKLTGNTQTGPAVAVADATTDASGNYSFANVPPSDATGYTITETQPSAYTDGKTTVTTPPGTAPTKPLTGSNPDAITGVVMPAGGALTGYNFGERYKGAISGVVYIDLNDNGVQDTGEPGIPGVTVALSGNTLAGAAVSVSPVSTNASGAYSFAGLPPSDATGYTVGETQPSAYRDGKTTAPTGTASASKPLAAGASDVITGVVLANGQALTGYNFGELAGSISGKVYIDANDNGVADTDETPLAGVTVKLTGTDSEGATVDKTVVTGADGTYSFTGLKNSNSTGYTITETQPSDVDGKTTAPTGTASSTKPVATGQPDVIGGVVLSGGAALTGYNFGERRTSSTISGFVYNDLNNNGVKDTAETGVSGVTVTLTGTSATGQAVSLTRTTGSDGAFSFNDVPPSNSAGYVLAELQPTGFTDGKNTIKSGNPGAQMGKKPTNTEDYDRIGTVVVPVSPVQYTDYLFGEIPLPTLLPPIVNGYVYLDKDHNRVRPRDGTVKGMAGWTVVLSQNGKTICTTTTADNGFYQFDNLHCPGYEQTGLPTGTGFKIAFSKDGSNLPAVPTSGGDRGTVPDTGGVIENITLNPADRVVEQNLPLDPAGVIYDVVTRQPIPGAIIRIDGPAGFIPSTMLVGGTNAQVQTVGADGFYQFLLQNGFPGGTYRLTVTAPEGYNPFPSTVLGPCQAVPLNVGPLPRPALVQASDTAPALTVPLHNPAACLGLVAGGVNTTQYYMEFVITATSADILNNHIPLDPIINNGVFVTKTTPLVTVSRGGLVPYTITVTNPLSAPLTNVKVRDQLPPGFQYRKGSASQDGAPANVNVTPNGFVEWPAENFTANQKKVYKLILIVGAGVGDGDYSNRAWMANAANDNQISNTAIATVRITPDPTLDCPEIIGRVFNDKNANGYDDDGEEGIPGVRMATPNGLLVTTDAEGRFHVPCPAIPNPDRGSNFVMKLDERTLPSGFRVTTENPRDVRLTRGKMAKLNFGATIHHVVRIELSDQAFQPGSTELLPEYRRQVDNLPNLLAAKPSVVRLAYIRGTDPQLSKQRIAGVRNLIDGLWKQVKGRYGLTIEIEGEK